jgi:hypothetical protein
LQNKANFPDTQMNLTIYLTKNYENNPAARLRKNKPNSKPISKKPKMSASSIPTRDYENQPLAGLPQNKPNQTQSQNRIQKPALSEAEGTEFKKQERVAFDRVYPERSRTGSGQA